MEQYSVQAVLSAVDKGFTSTIKNASSSINSMSSANKSALSSITRIASGIGVYKAVSAATSMLTSNISGAIDRYDTLNKYPKVLKNLGYSTEEANNSTKKLKEGVQGLPTSLDDIVSSAQNITVLTGNLDKSTDTALALNNALIASGASTDDCTRGMTQYVQMLSRGTVDMQSWRTLQETMGYALSETAKKLGIASGSSQELYDSLQSGSITFDEFNSALIECSNATGGFADQALTASGGIKTSWANINTAIKSGMANTISAIDQALTNSGLPTFEKTLASIQDKISKIFGKVEDLDDGTKKFDGGIVGAIGSMDNLKTIASQVGTVLAGAFTVAGSSGYFTAAGKSLTSFNSKIPSLGKGIDSVTSKATTAGNVLSGKLSIGGRVFGNLSKDAQETARKTDALKSVFKGTFDSGSSNVLQMTNENQKLVGKIDSARTSVLKFGDQSKSAFSMASNCIKDIVPDSIQSKFSTLGTKVSSAFGTVGDKASSTFGKITNKASSCASGVTSKFSALGSKLPKSFQTVGNAIGSNLGNGVKSGTNVGVKAMSGMVSSLGTVFSAAMSVLGPAAIVGLVVVGLGLVNQQFGTQINEILNTATKEGPKVITNFVSGITKNIPALAKSGTSMIAKIAKAIKANLPVIVQGAVDIISSLINGLSSNMNSLVKSGIEIIDTILNSIISAVPQLLMAGLDILVSITNGILANMPLIISSMQSMFTNIVTAIQTYLPQMITQGVQILTNIATGIAQMLPSIVTGIFQVMTTIVQTISDNLPQILDGAVQIVQSLCEGIANSLPDIIAGALNLIVTLAGALITNLPKILSCGVQIVVSLVKGLINSIGKIGSAAVKLAKQVIDKIGNTDWLKVGKDIISGIGKGISNSAGSLWDAAKKALGNFKDKVLGFFGIHSPSRWGVYVGRMIDTGLGNGISKYTRQVTTKAKAVYDSVANSVSGNVQGNLQLSYAMSGGNASSVLNDAIASKDAELETAGANYNSNAEYTINVPLDVDGKEFAKATATYTQEELDKQEKFNNYLKGVK